MAKPQVVFKFFMGLACLLAGSSAMAQSADDLKSIISIQQAKLQQSEADLTKAQADLQTLKADLQDENTALKARLSKAESFMWSVQESVRLLSLKVDSNAVRIEAVN